MKQYLYILPFVSLLLCTACTEADTYLSGPVVVEEGEGVPLSIKSLGLSVEMASRSIVTGGAGQAAPGLNPLKEVQVCVTKMSGSTVGFYDKDVKQQLFTYAGVGAGSGEAAGSETSGWVLAQDEAVLCLYTAPGTVYGYAPSSSKNPILTGTPKVPAISYVKVLDKQKFYFSDGDIPVDAATDIQWDTNQEDYLYGMAATQVDRWHPEVSLTMQHALAKVSFRVFEEGGGTAFADFGVEQVVLKSSGGLKKCTSAMLNLATGELSGTMTDVEQLTFVSSGVMRVVGSVAGQTGVANGGTVDASSVPIQAFGLVIPVENVNITLELTLDDGRTFNMKPVDGGSIAGTFAVNWKKGNNYIYNIRLSPLGIELADIKVAGWEDGGEPTDVPME